MAQTVKKLPAMQEMRERRVRFLGQKDPLEQEMATHSRILAWRIPWTEEPGGLQSTGSQRVRQFSSVQSLSRVRLFATPWPIQSMEFSRQEYWSR